MNGLSLSISLSPLSLSSSTLFLSLPVEWAAVQSFCSWQDPWPTSRGKRGEAERNWANVSSEHFPLDYSASPIYSKHTHTHFQTLSHSFIDLFIDQPTLYLLYLPFWIVCIEHWMCLLGSEGIRVGGWKKVRRWRYKEEEKCVGFVNNCGGELWSSWREDEGRRPVATACSGWNGVLFRELSLLCALLMWIYIYFFIMTGRTMALWAMNGLQISGVGVRELVNRAILAILSVCEETVGREQLWR